MVVEEAGRESIKGGGQVLQIVKGRCQADCIQLVRVHPEVSNGGGYILMHLMYIHHFCIIGWFPADKNQYWKNR